MDGLEDFLNTEPQAETPEPVQAEQQTEEQPVEGVVSEGPTRDEKGRFAPKGATETVENAETPQAASPAAEEPTLDHKALIGERRRRQEAEDRIRALEEQFARLQQPQVQPQQQQGPPDRWEDPDGYDRYLIEQAAHYAREQAVHAMNQQRIHQSAVRARGKYEDYDTAHQVFGEMAQRNPVLLDQMLASDDPAEFAYSEAKSEMDIRQHGSIEALIEARVAQRLAAAPPAPAPIPDTLADAQSSRGSSGQSFTAPSFDEILRRSAAHQ